MDDYPELPWSWTVPPALKPAWLAANRHQAALVIWTEGWARPQLTRGVFHPPSWSGHRDACPTQWGGACDCDLPPRIAPCTCHYRVFKLLPEGAQSEFVVVNNPALASYFKVNPRCHHHGDRAYGPFGPPTPAELAAHRTHDDIHNPYDLDTDERTNP